VTFNSGTRDTSLSFSDTGAKDKGINLVVSTGAGYPAGQDYVATARPVGSAYDSGASEATPTPTPGGHQLTALGIGN
jgi:hypothetical protein